MQDNFEKFLTTGLTGETAIAKWLRSRGKFIIPVYEKLIDNGKGPRLFTPYGLLIAPDMLVLGNDNIFWVEAKYKSGFAWYRKTRKFVTGVDLKHYLEYIQVSEQLPYPLWIMFLQRGESTKDCPTNTTPSGLYGGEISYLRTCESHRSDRWGSSGMVYWDIDSLKFIAPYEDVVNVNLNVPNPASGH